MGTIEMPSGISHTDLFGILVSSDALGDSPGFGEIPLPGGGIGDIPFPGGVIPTIPFIGTTHEPG